jgi:hypothetical protein
MKKFEELIFYAFIKFKAIIIIANFILKNFPFLLKDWYNNYENKIF